MPPPLTKKKAFVSYRHESEAHRKAVLAFCNRLAAALQDSGAELVNDQTLLETLPAGPDEGWNRWSMNMAAHADHVVAVISPGWFAAMDQKELEPLPGGKGSAVEATVIFNRHTHGRTISPWLRLVRLPTYPETETNWLFRDLPVFLGEQEADILALSRWIKGGDSPGGAGQPPPPGTPNHLSAKDAPDGGQGPHGPGKTGKAKAYPQPSRMRGALGAIGLTALAGAAGLGLFLHFKQGKNDGGPREEPVVSGPAATPRVDAVPAPTPAPSPPPEAPVAGALWAVPITADGSITMRFRWCPPGAFTMGRTRAEFNHLATFVLEDQPREKMQTEVTIREGFWISETELTLQQWSQIRGSGEPVEGGLPLTGITHAAAGQICGELSLQIKPTGMKARLPTEAEWEYACRAGSVEMFSFGEEMDWTDANFATDEPMPGIKKKPAKKNAVKVASYKPNNWAILDMHGNVSEWCDFMPGGGAAADATAGIQEGHFPARGGHWNSLWIGCTSGARNYQDGTLGTKMTGMRPVLSKLQQP